MLNVVFNSNSKIDDHSGLTSSDAIGGFGLFLFLLFFQLNATVAYIGLLVMASVFAVQAKTWMPLIKRDSVASVYLLISLYVVFFTIWAIVEFPATSEDQRKMLFNWLHWLFFIPVAWQQFRHRKYIDTMLLMLAAGVLIRIIVNFPWADFGKLFQTERTGFGMSMTVFAPIASSTVLGLLLLAPRIATQISTTTRWPLRLKTLGWLLASAILLESIVLTQTRGVWLASALVFPVALIVRYRSSLASHMKISIKSIAMLVLLCGFAGLFVVKNYQTIFNRINSEQVQPQPEVIKQQIQGQEVILTTSVGYRKILLEIGWRKWKERALLGWGPGTTEELLKQENNPLFSQSVTLKDGSTETLHLYHLHNLYLEFLVRFGVLGTLLFLTLPVLLMSNVWKAQANGSIPWDYVCFLFAGWTLMAITSFFDFLLYKYAWRNYCVIWAALTYAIHLEQLSLQHEKIQSKKQEK